MKCDLSFLKKKKTQHDERSQRRFLHTHDFQIIKNSF